ncbi:MAG: glycosyltransferase family 2 protein, partial [Bacilli bacterium]|nr:glycosyltransferase family 2 protein [Bacilli bacterium]
FNFFNNSKLTDMETCYKMFRKDCIKKITITENKFGLEPEITSKVISLGYNIKEVMIKYYPRTKKEGKKIKFSDGVEALKCIYHYRRGKNDRRV